MVQSQVGHNKQVHECTEGGNNERMHAAPMSLLLIVRVLDAAAGDKSWLDLGYEQGGSAQIPGVRVPTQSSYEFQASVGARTWVRTGKIRWRQGPLSLQRAGGTVSRHMRHETRSWSGGTRRCHTLHSLDARVVVDR